MAGEIDRRGLPELVDSEVVDERDIVVEEPPMPYPDVDLSDGHRSGELLATAWPLGESIYRLSELLKRYPVLASISDLPRAIELVKEADEIVKNLPTQEYPAPREPLTNDEAIAFAEELHRRLADR